MTIDEAKALSAQVDEAATALNNAIAAAAKVGLIIEIDALLIGQIWGGNVPLVNVTAKVRPSDIDGVPTVEPDQ